MVSFKFLFFEKLDRFFFVIFFQFLVDQYTSGFLRKILLTTNYCSLEFFVESDCEEGMRNFSVPRLFGTIDVRFLGDGEDYCGCSSS